MKKLCFIAFACSITLGLYAQEDCNKWTASDIDKIAADVKYLSSDALAGREPGTEGATMAYKYIAKAFKKAGLKALEKDYLQKFELSKDVFYLNENTSLSIDEKSLKIPTEAFPLQYASNGSAQGNTIYVGYGIVAPEKEYNDYKGFSEEDLAGKIFVLDISSPDGIHPHSEYMKYHNLGERVSLAKEKGAKAVLYINTEGSASDPRHTYRNISEKGIPVFFVQDAEVAESLKSSKKIALKTHLEVQKVEAANVVGLWDNKAETTVIIGAHYDHLGMGGSSSLYRGEADIHNGADDNASGTAGLLALAHKLKENKENFENHNYLFIAFSGEEMGLLGSSYFTKNAMVDMSKVLYMLNMDMIGRLENNELAVNGVGTSPKWESLIENANCEKLQIKTSESGVGPSDHTSFYYKDIPVLHFFSGTHEDYHKPSDDFEKINVKGEAQILNLMFHIMQQLDAEEALAFTKTKDEDNSGAPRFTVTLGVLPDYMYAEEGMKIDGVTEGRAADKAGLKAGDIVLKLGETKVEDMMSYMKALGQFKKGDKAAIEYKREGEILKGSVQF